MQNLSHFVCFVPAFLPSQCQTTVLLELLHTDVLSINVPLLRGRRYVVTFVHNHSRVLWVKPLTRKSDAFITSSVSKASAESKLGKRML